ncbi:hydroxyacid dehydrogenase [Streptomyces sp. SID3343]|uniref:hydroxyacid dehydrogenase n=1 Tax=Streptomyces sp. SID3343 TaxID=2690260 RepID=UPI0031F9EE06
MGSAGGADSAGDAGAGCGRPVIVVAVAPGLREEFFGAGEPGVDGMNGVDAVNGEPGGVERLRAVGEVVLVDDPTDVDALRTALVGADVVVSSWGMPRLTGELLAAADRVGLLAHTGAAISPYVGPDAFARGVRVTQAGQGMARSVAEVALAFTLALLHRTHRFDHALRGGLEWEHASVAPPRHEVLGSRIGVVGASRTGRAYIDVVRALGARVRVADPTLTVEGARDLGVELVDLDTLLATSRIVALHAPSLPETRHLIGARELALLPDGAGLVNTARSWLVDERALLAELSTARIDAALDVYDDEPLPVDHPLRAMPNVLLTPHRAAGTVECRRRQGDIVVDEVTRYLTGRPLAHEVGPDALVRVG